MIEVGASNHWSPASGANHFFNSVTLTLQMGRLQNGAAVLKGLTPTFFLFIGLNNVFLCGESNTGDLQTPIDCYDTTIRRESTREEKAEIFSR